MVKMKTRFISMLLLAACLLSMVSVSAQGITPYASDQLNAYDATIVACGGGVLAIEFSVEGTGRMKSIGASKIRVYEQYGTDGWMLAETFTKNDTGMTTSDRNAYGTTMYFNGDPGTYYKIEVTIFATDYDGITDSRTMTRYKTA